MAQRATALRLVATVLAGWVLRLLLGAARRSLGRRKSLGAAELTPVGNGQDKSSVDTGGHPTDQEVLDAHRRCPRLAKADGIGDQEPDWDCPPELKKTRPCRWLLSLGRCNYGSKCHFAHTRDELKIVPDRWRVLPLLPAAHWDGALVAIGVVEHALFNDLPPAGTLDVVCDRCTCLGNPFAARKYRIGEVRPKRDQGGWSHQEHEDLCAAFDEYLSDIFAAADDAEEAELEAHEPLEQVVRRICKERSMVWADTWMLLKLSRRDVRHAVERLDRRLRAGGRLRLLCHCRPHVRCHCEFLKAHLEMQLPPEVLAAAPEVPSGRWVPAWPPDSPSDEPKCTECKQHPQRALDPVTEASCYCAFCWMRYADDLKWKGLQVADWERQHLELFGSPVINHAYICEAKS